MGKKWYDLFVVTDGPGEDPGGQAPSSLPGPNASTAIPRQPSRTRVSDAVSAVHGETAFATPVANPTSLEEIYQSAQIATPAHGYTILKVAEMLQNEHIRALPADVKRKSVLVALDAASVTIREIIEDAVRRDRALDTYERVLQKNLEDLRTQKDLENQRTEEEINRKLAELRARIEANNQEVSREQESLLAWRGKKRQEEDRIAEAVGYFVEENPITTVGRPAPPGNPSKARTG